MTLDDETATLIERTPSDDELRRIARKATGTGYYSGGVKALRAVWKARDAEVEELRAERDILLATDDGNLSAMRERAEKAERERDEALATLAKVASAARGFAANGDFAGKALLAVLHKSPTERETPADEPIAKRLTHTYMGDCPDDVNGWESRDPECPACRALVEVVPDDRA